MTDAGLFTSPSSFVGSFAVIGFVPGNEVSDALGQGGCGFEADVGDQVVDIGIGGRDVAGLDIHIVLLLLKRILSLALMESIILGMKLQACLIQLF